MGVALGEAGSNPCAHSMIADLYPLARRGAAIGLLNASASIGIGFGLLFGGWLSTQFNWRDGLRSGRRALHLPRLDHTDGGSRASRGMSEGCATRAPAEIPPLRDTLAWLGRLRIFRYLALSAMTCAFVNYGLQIWAASFFIRVHGMSAQEVGLKLGVASAVGLFAVPSVRALWLTAWAVMTCAGTCASPVSECC